MKSSAAFFVCFLLLADLLHAQTPMVELSVRYVESFGSDFNSLGTPLNHAMGPGNSIMPTDYHEFVVDMQVMGLSYPLPGEEVRGFKFDVELGPNLEPETFNGFGSYFGTHFEFDLGPMPPVRTWDVNDDLGGDAADLEEIVVDSNSQNIAITAYQPGENTPFEVGRFYLNLLDLTTDTFVTLAPHGEMPWSIWDQHTSIPQPESTFHVGEPFLIRVVPEPSAVWYLMSATAWWIAVRRRRSSA